MNKHGKLHRDRKDERLSSLLAPIYRTGFYLLAGGILFDLYTRYNYLAQTDDAGTTLVHDPLETAVLLVGLLYVGVAQARCGVFSDSLRVVEAENFSQTGLAQKGLAVASLISVAAVGGRLYNEVRLFGWEGVTWAGDVAMLIVMLGMFSALFVSGLYLSWKGHRYQEARNNEDD